jgi:hypothetical protein
VVPTNQGLHLLVVLRELLVLGLLESLFFGLFFLLELGSLADGLGNFLELVPHLDPPLLHLLPFLLLLLHLLVEPPHNFFSVDALVLLALDDLQFGSSFLVLVGLRFGFSFWDHFLDRLETVERI